MICHGASTTRPNLDTDPQEDWWTVDQEAHILTKSLGRYNKGALARSLGGKEIKTSIASLSLNQQIGDSITLDVKGGYSNTTDDTLPNASVSTATWAIVSSGQFLDVPTDKIQPVGYDCSTGKCTFIFGDDAVLNDATSNTLNGNYANTTTNPLNPYSMHLGALGRYDTYADDTNKSLFIDLDWDTEFDHITKFETGIKFSQRIKEVRQNKQNIEGESITAFDPETGLPLKSDNPQDVLLVDFMSKDAFPVDNFMEGLVPDRQQPFLGGWSMIDPFAAFEAAFTKPDVQIRPDLSESRKVTQDNVSVYAKLNFEAFSGRLTGNIGARYVKTKVDADAYTSVKFESRNNMFTPYDLVYKKGLANSSLPVCNPSLFESGGLDHQFPAEPNCYDWALTHMHQWSDQAGTTPHYVMEDRDGDGINERYVMSDWLAPDNEIYVLQVAYNDDGTVRDVIRNEQSDGLVDGYEYSQSRDWWMIRRWLDLSTSDAVGQELFGEDEKYLAANRVVPTSDQADNSILLPSLNLNYAFSEEVIGRFALSKTMSRPTFDDLRPRANLNENPWGDAGWGNRTTTQLQPLESKNIDLSFEWYFNDSGLLSVAFFRKDMKNFLHSITETFYYKDIRETYDLGDVAINELLIVPEEGMTPSNSDCMPDRMIQSQVKDAWTFGCHPLDVSIKRNGKGSVNQGIEFNYSQNYDFLPEHTIWLRREH
ncbi:TonB-dependent receptor [Paraglaciecola aquimarina]|uniref:TonB-dependent receptor n=1 Tax=Paraglaciecola aquimarina TaxID=1235557 RepID=A0ABU3SXN0_9ALTE|nr:TonB-dependent receptor [Paraglaciecola aquimarina]MDU0354772.1 TonB-dependent receptor [Paraglaciecola aquimarina]